MVNEPTEKQSRNTELVRLLDELMEGADNILTKYPKTNQDVLVSAYIIYAMVIYRNEFIECNFETAVSKLLSAWKIVDDFEEEGYLQEDEDEEGE